MKIKRPMFFGKRGWWGERGYVRISFLKYLWIKQEYVTKVRWIKCIGK